MRFKRCATIPNFGIGSDWLRQTIGENVSGFHLKLESANGVQCDCYKRKIAFFRGNKSLALECLGISAVKQEQHECIKRLVCYCSDVFAILPTGYGKSLIYQLLPRVFQIMHRLHTGENKKFNIIVVSLLQYIRQQQVASMRNSMGDAYTFGTNACKNASCLLLFRIHCILHHFWYNGSS